MAYQKPLVEKFGTFRELTRFGISSASDGASIFGIGTSPGCDSRLLGPIGCPTGPTTS
jgi:hypothetical protein